MSNARFILICSFFFCHLVLRGVFLKSGTKHHEYTFVFAAQYQKIAKENVFSKIPFNNFVTVDTPRKNCYFVVERNLIIVTYTKVKVW